MLSEASQTFDPLGLVSPCIMLTKILIQRLWILKLGWNDLLPSDIQQEWLCFRNDLLFLNNINIARQALFQNDVIEIHGFSDASQKARSHLLCAKGREHQ